MRMSDLNKFEIPKHFVIDWDHVQHLLMGDMNPSDRELLDRYFPKRPGGGAGSSTTASSTSGAVTPIKQVPAVGEQWWVKLPNQDRLELVRIGGISNASVAIIVANQRVGGLRDGRYERDYFKFVEQYVLPSLEPKPV